MKTNELTGAALDWAVAQCIGLRVYIGRNHTMTGPEIIDADLADMDVDGPSEFRPSSNWSQGGPIIERERINVDPSPDSPEWYGYYDNNGKWYAGPTPLIAAMRCYVASKLGEDVSIPEELT